MQKRTRRLDKHKQMGPCIYNIMKDSIGMGRKTRMAAVGLLYAGYIVQKYSGRRHGTRKGRKTKSKNMRAFRRNNNNKVVRPVYGKKWPTVLCTEYCTA